MTAAPVNADARAHAARVLARLRGGSALDALWPEADAALPDPRDRALLRAIVYATVRGLFRYDAVLQRMLSQPAAALDPLIRALLLTGLAQLDSGITPAYAAVSGSVAAARSLRKEPLAKLVNAILRRYQREATTLKVDDGDETARYNHPQWLIDALRADWPQDWGAILEANNAQAPLWLRSNRRVGSAADYAQTLNAVGIAARTVEHFEDALMLDASIDVTQLPGFEQGRVSVQDGAAQLAAELLDLKPGLAVLDACAAPGGKAAHALEREPRLDRLLALDSKRERVTLMRSTFKRLGLGASVTLGDATKPPTWWDGRPFQRILIDAPCSGTGVIRRHPDIRLLRRASDLPALTALQDRLLDALWPLLAAGGRLVYATCSVLSDENERRIAAFLERTPGAMALDAVPQHFGRSTGAGRQNLPGEGGMDGFYYAVLAHRS